MAKKKSTKVAVRPMTFNGAVTSIGVDASWTNCAVTAGGHESGGPWTIRMSEVISTKPGEFPSQSARLESLGMQFLQAICVAGIRDVDEPKFPDDMGPTLVAIEGYAMGSKTRPQMAGELGGHLRLLLWQAGIPYIIVPPTSLKAYTSGSGQSKKSMMMMMAFKRWGYEAAGEDECDAYCLARIAAEFAAGGWTKKFTEFAQKLEVVGCKDGGS